VSGFKNKKRIPARKSWADTAHQPVARRRTQPSGADGGLICPFVGMENVNELMDGI